MTIRNLAMSETDEASVVAKAAEVTTTSDVPRCNGVLSSDAPEAAKRSMQMSDASSALIEESMRLLNMKSSVNATLRPPSPGPLIRSRSASPDSGLFSASSTAIYPRPTPTFKRIDFDDRLEEMGEEKRPPWKTWQESVKDSYHKAKRTVERNKDETDFLEKTLIRPRKTHRDESPFRHLDTDTGFVSSYRSKSSLNMPSLSDRSRLLTTSPSMSHVFASGSGPYAAPAVSSTQGIESRYDSIARDVEARLLKTSPLPSSMKVITRKEFRNAPNPSAGSASEQDDYDFSMYCPKPYYSRPNRDDPDYFDYDLQHSVDLFRRPEGKYTPRGPQEWETKLLGEAGSKGSAPISGYMFTRGDSDWRTSGSSYLSAALRTPKYWEQRFENLGKEIRDSNPVSLDSINRRIRQIEEDRRNRPVASRFTEYRDPDHEDYLSSDDE